MAVRCTACGGIRQTTAELDLSDADRVRVGGELLRAVGPVAVRTNLGDPLDLVAYPLNILDVACPQCGSVRWSDRVDQPPDAP